MEPKLSELLQLAKDIRAETGNLRFHPGGASSAVLRASRSLTRSGEVRTAQTAYTYLQRSIAPETNFGLWENRKSEEEVLEAFDRAIELAEKEEVVDGDILL